MSETKALNLVNDPFPPLSSLARLSLPFLRRAQSRPPDLVGSWALEAAGWDGVSDIPADGSEMEDLGLNDLVVAFRKDGTVQVPVEKGVGLGWRVEPGPTHLDTIYFDMIPAAPTVRCREGVREGGGGGAVPLRVYWFGCLVVYFVGLFVCEIFFLLACACLGLLFTDT